MAYALLTSPVSWLVVGEGCGEVASDPRGVAEARATAKAGRLDMLRNLARGPNPEGRVLAALQLVKASKALSTDDAALIDRVRAATPIVQSCHGCSSGTEPVDRALPAPDR